jgi:two-component system, response regulator PdtaR
MFRVLIVEDDLSAAKDLEDALSDAGWQVCGTASSVVEALRLGEATKPAFAIVDVGLSSGHGRVVAEELVRRYDTAVLMTTVRGQEFESLAATGALACLPKPLDAERVPAALHALLFDLKAGRAVRSLPPHMFRLGPVAPRPWARAQSLAIGSPEASASRL